MNFDSDEEDLFQEDYYAFLNVPKEATKEEINNAYRRLSRIYHPDKHLELQQKQKAEVLFNRTKKAYEVLSDPHQRAIYDSLGLKGLETEGWEIVQRMKTPAEIRAEYEQLEEERAERRKQQRTNPRGTITVNINATDIFNPYIDELGLDDETDEFDVGLFPTVEISGMTFNQSIEMPLTQKDTCQLEGQLHTHNGTGGGDLTLSWRHIFSHKSWLELEMGAGNGPVMSIRAFRTLNKRFFWNGGGMMQFVPEGIRPGIFSTLALQIDKHSVGYLTYHRGIRSLISTSVVRDTEHGFYKGAIQVGLPHSFVTVSYTKKMLNQELKLKLAIKGGTFGGIVEYGVEKKVSKHSWLSAVVAVGVPTGVRLKIKLTRANQTYNFPIHLCEEIMPAAVFYGTVAPIVAYIIIKKGVVEPFRKEQQTLKAEKQKVTNLNKLLERKREADAAIQLMSATYTRSVTEEEARNGLVIARALYGKLANGEANRNHDDSKIIDVTIPLQCLIKDSKLVLYEQSKSHLPGFFDPAVGEEKCLNVQYKYRNKSYETTVRDSEMLRIPQSSHLNSVT